MNGLRGFRLDAYEALPVETPQLPPYLAQIRYLQALRGYLDLPIYAIRAKEVLRAGGLRSADQIRRHVGLESDQKLALLLFDKDELIESFSGDAELVLGLAAANFDLITSGSYSAWEPRPRLHQLYNLTRSAELCVALQREGAPAVPRLDWLIDRDVQRWAQWLETNRCIELVSIDAMTYRSTGWSRLTAGLELLDCLTEHRLRYLVNGPSTEDRWEELFSILGQERLTVTDARLVSGPPSLDEQLAFPGPHAVSRGPRYRDRVRRRIRDVGAVRARAARAH